MLAVGGGIGGVSRLVVRCLRGAQLKLECELRAQVHQAVVIRHELPDRVRGVPILGAAKCGAVADSEVRKE
jgi:non-ribosomal peptide synthetase component E (peptide arylation enzyme)